MYRKRHHEEVRFPPDASRNLQSVKLTIKKKKMKKISLSRFKRLAQELGVPEGITVTVRTSDEQAERLA